MQPLPAGAGQLRAQLACVQLAHATALVPAQGIYVLQDNNFRWLLRLAPLSSAAAGSDASRAELLASVAAPYLDLPCGIIRGALRRHGSAWVCVFACCCVETTRTLLPP